MQDAADALSLALDPSRIFAAMEKPPDPWQVHALTAKGNILLNCCRQAGKSTVAGALAAHISAFRPGSLSIILSRAQRQAAETFRKFLDAFYALRVNLPFRHVSTLHAEFANGSRVLALPGKEETARGYSGVQLLIVDEAARVPDDLYRAIRPMLAVSNGQIVLMSTPFGQRGFFYREWTGQGKWTRITVAATEIRRIAPAFLEEERRSMGEEWYQQEYCNSFTSVTGLVYPDFDKCIIDVWPIPRGRRVGGIDWGWANPFAAVWGIHDTHTDILYIGAERYKRYTPLHEHRDALKPLGCTWVADPAGATEISEFRAASIPVYKGNNDVKAGIAAVTARIRSGRLKIMRTCVEVLGESQLYRYPDKREFVAQPEKPIDDSNHALSAIRYLVAKIDTRFMAKFRRLPDAEPTFEEIENQKALPARPAEPEYWRRLRNSTWTVVN